mmetsp:Transcript_29074/g.58442  ORF Transcript_29074/g.58442 Transcript_29074/m.58442 type:complete len:210 (-) Transcript_29074:39-668(-)
MTKNSFFSVLNAHLSPTTNGCSTLVKMSFSASMFSTLFFRRSTFLEMTFIAYTFRSTRFRTCSTRPNAPMPTTQSRSKSSVVGTRKPLPSRVTTTPPRPAIEVSSRVAEGSAPFLAGLAVWESAAGSSSVPPAFVSRASSTCRPERRPGGTLPITTTPTSSSAPTPAPLNSAASQAVIRPPPRLGGELTRMVLLFERSREGDPHGDPKL